MANKITKANGHIVQPDWNETDEKSFSYIHNKPETASSEAAGLMSPEDKEKLDGIEEGAEVNVIEIMAVRGTKLASDNKIVNINVPGAIKNGVELFNDIDSHTIDTNSILSHIEGTTNSIKQSNYTHIEGGDNQNLSGSVYSHTEGRYNNQYYCVGGHAEGYNNSILGGSAAQGQHVEGCGVISAGRAAHAEGQGYIGKVTGIYFTKNGNTISGSFSENIISKITPQTVVAIYDPSAGKGQLGYIGKITSTTITLTNTLTFSCTSKSAYCIFSDSLALGMCSHVEGRGCQALGIASHAEGQFTVATTTGEHVSGMFNRGLGGLLEEVGNGTSFANLSNARTLDVNGNAWYAGTVSIGEQNLPLATEAYVTATANNLSCEVLFDETEIILTMESNKEYRANNPVTALAIQSFVNGIPGVANQWSVIFTTGDTITIAHPETVKWAIATPVFEPNKTYWLSFVPYGTNYLGVWTVIE